MTLAYGGCRLSEALALTADRVDLAGGLLLFEILKKRRRGIHRGAGATLAARRARPGARHSQAAEPAREGASASGPGAA
jgi:integrase/recombinase XerD